MSLLNILATVIGTMNYSASLNSSVLLNNNIKRGNEIKTMNTVYKNKQELLNTIVPQNVNCINFCQDFCFLIIDNQVKLLHQPLIGYLPMNISTKIFDILLLSEYNNSKFWFDLYQLTNKPEKNLIKIKGINNYKTFKRKILLESTIAQILCNHIIEKSIVYSIIFPYVNVDMHK